MRSTTLPRPRRIFMLGATGTIGRATVRELVQRGHEVVCLVRPQAKGSADRVQALQGAQLRPGEVQDAASLWRDGFRGEPFDAMVSCMASRTGVAADAWAVDHAAHVQALQAAQRAGVRQVVLLSAICVQKPRLAFQQAKLAFEQVLMQAGAQTGLQWSIVRPTAFFKSLSGQVERVRRGQPFLVFGSGELTACKPISNPDLATYLADCLDDPARSGRVLPVGGPGAAITPLQQAQMLHALLERPTRIRSVPVALLDVIAGALGAAGRIVPALRTKAELARIGRYYATESMLVMDPHSGCYDAAATPSTGTQTLHQHYARLLAGDAASERGDHAVF